MWGIGENEEKANPNLRSTSHLAHTREGDARLGWEVGGGSVGNFVGVVGDGGKRRMDSEICRKRTCVCVVAVVGSSNLMRNGDGFRKGGDTREEKRGVEGG